MACEFDACPDHDGPCIPWAGKPVLACGIAVEHTSGSATMGAENEAVRACVNTPDPATPDEPGDDDAER